MEAHEGHMPGLDAAVPPPPPMAGGHHHMVIDEPPLDLDFNPFTCWLFILCGVTIPLGIRLSHCHSVSKSSLGNLLNFGNACVVLIGTAAWTLNAMDSVALILFVPVAAALIGLCLGIFSPGTAPQVGEEGYLPFSLTCLRDFIEIYVLWAGLLMPLFGLYAYLNVTTTPHFVGDIIGHFVPGTFVAFFSQIGLRFHKKGDLLGFQKVEGIVMLTAGVCDLILHIYGNSGSVLRPLFGYDHGNWMKNEQHVLDLCVWILAGSLALGFYYSGYQTGFHMFIPGVANFLVMTQHPQPNELMTMLHVSFGALVFIAALFRIAEKIPEYCVMSALGGYAFVFGTPHLGHWAIHIFPPSAYFSFLLVTVGGMWSYNYALWNTPLVEGSNRAAKAVLSE
mmetsp:Transcript_18927/g.29687  ORF Transcript_18927/g.29687 Transcript_18927/m.29687 type:complete len:393 (-) Transcript_18927:2-1180(-)